MCENCLGEVMCGCRNDFHLHSQVLLTWLLGCFSTERGSANSLPNNYPLISQLFTTGEVNIGECLPSRRQGKHSPIFTEPESNNCFHIILRCGHQKVFQKKTELKLDKQHVKKLLSLAAVP